jgi:hypothetical protein
LTPPKDAWHSLRTSKMTSTRTKVNEVLHSACLPAAACGAACGLLLHSGPCDVLTAVLYAQGVNLAFSDEDVVLRHFTTPLAADAPPLVCIFCDANLLLPHADGASCPACTLATARKPTETAEQSSALGVLAKRLRLAWALLSDAAAEAAAGSASSAAGSASSAAGSASSAAGSASSAGTPTAHSLAVPTAEQLEGMAALAKSLVEMCWAVIHSNAQAFMAPVPADAAAAERHRLDEISRWDAACVMEAYVRRTCGEMAALIAAECVRWQPPAPPKAGDKRKRDSDDSNADNDRLRQAEAEVEAWAMPAVAAAGDGGQGAPEGMGAGAGAPRSTSAIDRPRLFVRRLLLAVDVRAWDDLVSKQHNHHELIKRLTGFAPQSDGAGAGSGGYDGGSAGGRGGGADGGGAAADVGSGHVSRLNSAELEYVYEPDDYDDGGYAAAADADAGEGGGGGDDRGDGAAGAAAASASAAAASVPQ